MPDSAERDGAERHTDAGSRGNQSAACYQGQYLRKAGHLWHARTVTLAGTDANVAWFRFAANASLPKIAVRDSSVSLYQRGYFAATTFQPVVLEITCQSCDRNGPRSIIFMWNYLGRASLAGESLTGAGTLDRTTRRCEDRHALQIRIAAVEEEALGHAAALGVRAAVLRCGME